MKTVHFILFLLISLGINAQDDRPRVGLVLSGGSAHGLAHIGVLKVLEEQGVKIDYITGTSMGSIIGGLYAMGRSAEEIEKLTREQDWSELLATDVPLDEIAPSEKTYHNRYGLTLEIKEGGVSLPRGFLNSQKLDLQLNRMFCPAHDIDNFDNLAYPFKCVSVNIENGDVEVLDHGYLGTAVRSSMAIPSVFAPVEMDGKLLVDGGLIRNFPVDEVIEMGADIIIGVYVGSKLEEKESLNNLLEILNQSAFMMGILDSEEQKEKVDILIEPDVKNFPSFGFDQTDVLTREGYIAATEQIEKIKQLAESQKAYQVSKPESLSSIEELDVTDTRFPFIRSPFDALANFKYGNLFTSGEVGLDRIENGITRIFGSKHFENINYTFLNNSRGDKILSVLAKPRKINTLSGTFNFMPSSSTSLVLTNELRNILDEPSVLYTTVRLAENYGAKVDYYYRLGNKKDFILNILGKIHRYDQNLYEVETLRERYAEINAKGHISIGYEPNNEIFISGSAGLDGYVFKPVGLDEESLSKYQRVDATLKGEVLYDNINDLQFPTRGIRVGVQSGVHGPVNSKLSSGNQNPLVIPEDNLYVNAHIKGEALASLTKEIVIAGDIAAGYKSTSSLIDNYRIGGIENRDYKSIVMLGLNTHQLHMEQFYKIGGKLQVNLFSGVYGSLKVDYLSGSKAFRLESDESGEDVSLWGVGAILGIKSPLGPLQFAYGRNSLTNSWNTNFTFGYAFF